MAIEYFKAPQAVVEIVRDMQKAHHPDLAGARIGVIMRETAPKRGEKQVVYGKASKVTAKQQVFMNYDFIICFSQDIWETLDKRQRYALADHELCHCTITPNEEARMVYHDLEEFLCIIERHGFWWPQSQEAELVFQSRFGHRRHRRLY